MRTDGDEERKGVGDIQEVGKTDRGQEGQSRKEGDNQEERDRDR